MAFIARVLCIPILCLFCILCSSSSNPRLSGRCKPPSPRPPPRTTMDKIIISSLKEMLQPYGIDIVHPLALDWYNSSLPPHLLSHAIPLRVDCVSTHTRDSSVSTNALTLLIGNSKAVWEPFLAYCKSKYAENPGFIITGHPLEAYVEQAIVTALSKVSKSGLPMNSDIIADAASRYRIFWSHCQSELVGGVKGHVAMQRMAEYSGLAYLDHTSHLSMHPEFGPWFSLRAVVVFDEIPFYYTTKPEILECPLTAEQLRMVKDAASAAMSPNSDPKSNTELKDVRQAWQKWVAIRDAAYGGVNHPHRYTEHQILYHYTGDRKLLLQN